MIGVAVGVFHDIGRSGKPVRWRAYTQWFHPNWEGCCMHWVRVEHRRDAKRAAIDACKRGDGCKWKQRPVSV